MVGRGKILFVVSIMVLILGSCDKAYPPALCNGFGQAVVLSVVKDDGAVGTATIETNASVVMQIGGRYQSFIVKSKDGKELLAYPPERLRNVPFGGFGGTHFWLLTPKGVFHVPPEYERTWQEHITDIEKFDDRLI